MPLGVLAEKYESAREDDENRDGSIVIQNYGDKGYFDETGRYCLK